MLTLLLAIGLSAVTAQPTDVTGADALGEHDEASQKYLSGVLSAMLQEQDSSDRDLFLSGDFFRIWFALHSRGPLAHKVDTFWPLYGRHLSPFRSQQRVIFVELGVQSGGSIELWKAFFGKRLVYHGIDINPLCAQFNDPARNVHVHIGSVLNRSFLHGVTAAIGEPIDIVLDDASHMSAHMIRAFGMLSGHLQPHGLYMVEDTFTQYWPHYWSGARKNGTFIEYAKSLVDDLNAFNSADAQTGYYTNRPTAHDRLPPAHQHGRYDWRKDPAQFAHMTHSVLFYDGIVCIERGTHVHFKHVRRGDKVVPYIARR